MTFQQSDLDRLNTAIGSGVRKVTFADGRSTEYQNLDQMLKARDVIANELAGSQARSTRRQRRIIVGRVGRL
ncbi:phage head-tail joining protein [Sphingobium rhizovicinum]|uniref:Phage head-tail joining protein n=1 Tax=Sphingobium rhizovicinum TaxID=432308 RepID=A0ABV7NK48_9SPHN